MNELEIIPKIQDVDVKNKVVLIRVDHNVVKKGKIKDSYRIDVSMETINYVLKNGGKPIIMTHVGRPKDKKTGTITISPDDAVHSIVDYLHKKYGIKCVIPKFDISVDKGLTDLLNPIKTTLEELKRGDIEAIYLPNTRFFAGEEDKGELKKSFSKELASIADIFVNDAFGSWQPHASTVGPVEYIPSYAGLLMQKEVVNLEAMFKPKRPFIAIVAGSKFDTKIKPLETLIHSVDHLLLGGVILNAYIAVKYGLTIKGIAEEDMKIANDFVDISDKYPGKVIVPEYVVESDSIEGKFEGQYRTHKLSELKKGTELNYILDIGIESYENEGFRETIMKAETFFINAVMGLVPYFDNGTKYLYELLDKNKQGLKLYGGGDTLQEFKNLLPDLYERCIKDEKYYFFTGGGTILTAIEQGSPWKLDTLKALIDKAKEKKH